MAPRAGVVLPMLPLPGRGRRPLGPVCSVPPPSSAAQTGGELSTFKEQNRSILCLGHFLPRGHVFCFSLLDSGNILVFEGCYSWGHILLLLPTEPGTPLINVDDKREIDTGDHNPSTATGHVSFQRQNLKKGQEGFWPSASLRDVAGDPALSKHIPSLWDSS